LNITADNHITISKVNKVLFSGKNLTIEANRNNRRSVLCFDNYPKKKKSLDRRQVFLKYDHSLIFCFSFRRKSRVEI
jgi:hypothetical protein